MPHEETPPRSSGDDAPTRWLALEQIFAANRYDGSMDDADGVLGGSAAAWSAPAPGLIEVAGSLRPDVVVTASHATNHVRAGKPKLADRGTGGLALLLSELTGCTALVALGSAADAPGDANYDTGHPLKDRLAELSPAVVIDLHGMRTREGSDIDLGTGSGPVPERVVDCLRRSDLQVTTNEVFDAMRPTTVTSSAQSHGIPAVQVEIGAHLRAPSGDAAHLSRLVALLVAAAEAAVPAQQPVTGLAPVPVRIPSGIPTAVVHPDLLPGTTGPVPVTVRSAERTAIAWAWSAAAPGLPDPAPRLTRDQVGTTRRLDEALSGGGSTDSTGPVSLTVPRMARYRALAALADDLPGPDEIHVSPRDMPVRGSYLLVRRGVTAWVDAVPRDHVRPGTVRLTYQLRLLTASDRPGDEGDDGHVVLVAAPRAVVAHARRPGRLQRFGTAADRGFERMWRFLFRAPEFSARVIQAHAGDDGSAVVALHPAVFDRIGVESGQQVLVRWGGREVVALAVVDHDPPLTGAPTESMRAVQRVNRLSPDLPDGISPHVVARLSARLRVELDAPTATVVTVRRRLRPVLVRNLNGLVIPLASLVLAGAALPDPHWPTLGLGTALMSVFALARLRIPQPRPGTRVDDDWVARMATDGAVDAEAGEKVVQ